MTMPTQREIRLPLLKLGSDNKEHSIREAIRILSEHFTLTEEEKDEWLPSGNERIFENRLRWSKWDLKEAGLIENTRRGHFKITDKGSEFLSNNPKEISYENIRKFKDELADAEESTTTMLGEFIQTPDELIVNSFQTIEEELKEDLLVIIKNCSAKFFERLVIDLLLKMGYGKASGDIGRIVGGTGDGGLDGIIYQDKLGLERIYIQAKKWDDTTVGRSKLQEFVGALEGIQALKGVFITTSKFSREAKEYAEKNNRIVIIDGKKLAQLMMDHDLGVSTVEIYKRKRIDYDYFPEE